MLQSFPMLQSLGYAPPQASSVQRQGYGTEKYEQLAQELPFILNEGYIGTALRNKLQSLLDKVEGYAKGLNAIVPNGLQLQDVACLKIPHENDEARTDAYSKALREVRVSYRQNFPKKIMPQKDQYYLDYKLNFFKIQSAKYDILRLQIKSQLDRLNQ